FDWQVPNNATIFVCALAVIYMHYISISPSTIKSRFIFSRIAFISNKFVFHIDFYNNLRN
ncbi:MAG: hypothetical protein LBB06_02500, partial [Endomicrobium sp.]|nr:hypothetical protein [Endomicrobium sp.]